MYDKILVALDLSPCSKAVFDKALSVAKADGANLILLHVLSVEEETSPPFSAYLGNHQDRCIHVSSKIMQRANEIYQEEWRLFEQKGLEMLRFYDKKARLAGVKTEFTQITGHPNSVICDFAGSCHADLIVIGRRGYSGLKEMFLGSVSNYVVHHAPCSILLVQTPIREESTSAKPANNTVYV